MKLLGNEIAHDKYLPESNGIAFDETDKTPVKSVKSIMKRLQYII